MESKFFDILYQYLLEPIVIQQDNSGIICVGDVPLEKFYIHSKMLESRFLGECIRNIEKLKNSPEFLVQEFESYEFKFTRHFKEEFSFEFNESRARLEEWIYQSRDTIYDVEYRTAYGIKWKVYQAIFERLNSFKAGLIMPPSIVPSTITIKAPRAKSTIYSFKLNLSIAQLWEIRETMIKLNLIDASTTRDAFSNAFSGKGIPNKIVWTEDQHSLYLFVSELNKKEHFGRKINDGIWEIVADIFQPKKRPYFDPKKIAHSRPTKHKKYDSIKSVVDQIKHLKEEV